MHAVLTVIGMAAYAAAALAAYLLAASLLGQWLHRQGGEA